MGAWGVDQSWLHPGVNDCRLSPSSSDPIAESATFTTFYLTPHVGNRIGLWNGNGWQMGRVDSAPSASPPANTNTPFDVFAYLNSGVVAIECLAWTNDTTRATALTRQNGVLVKSGNATRRYVGTGRTTGTSGQCASSITKRFLTNHYNRIRLPLYVQEDSPSGTNISASATVDLLSDPPSFIFGSLDFTAWFVAGIRSTSAAKHTLYWTEDQAQAILPEQGMAVLPTDYPQGAIPASYYNQPNATVYNNDSLFAVTYTHKWVSGYLMG